MNLIRYLERLVAKTAKAAWPAVKYYNARFERPSAKPAWAPAPLLKRRERTFPQLGWPRETDSLCPRCVKEVRTEILDGDARASASSSTASRARSRPTSSRRTARSSWRRRAPKHGTFDDVMAIDPQFLAAHRAALSRARLQGAADAAARPRHLERSSTAAASVLTVDLTNRCNMMCDPCFMDANQVGYVHELDWDEMQEDPRRLADDQAAPPDERAVLGRRADAVAALPRRHPLRAQESATSPCSARPTACASPQEPGFAKKAKEAGPAHGVPAVRRRQQRGQLAPQDRQPLRRQAARHREAARGRHRRHPRGHRRQRRQQRPGRPDPRISPIDNADKITVVSFQPVQLHRPRRGHRRRDARAASATRCRTSRTT